jgi:5-methylthioadenosine/S-adenosylhomocysteine deaminase
MGRKVLDNGELTTLDSRDIIARAELWRKKISGE